MYNQIRKLVVAVTCILAVQVTASAQKISEYDFRKDRYSVEEVIDILQKSEGLNVVYNDELIDLQQKIQVEKGKSALEETLVKAFTPLGLKISFAGDCVVINNKEIDDKVVARMGARVSGNVKDSNGDPLIGATVVIPGTARTAITDLDGNFSFVLPPHSRVMVVDFLGMKTEYVLLANTDRYDIMMQPGGDMLDEVVVMGYGSQKKADITGAVTSISSKDIDRNIGAGIETALQGKIPGLNIVTNSGEPGSGSTITLRGASSINGSSEPLYIIDGVPVESSNTSTIGGDATFSPLATINPADIESINVLRDAASASIYGSRAANGVVIITTKGGNDIEVKRPTITVAHRSGIAAISHFLPLMDGLQFRDAYADARANQGNGTTYPWVTNFAHPQFRHSTDWQRLMYRPTYQQKTDISMNGSTDKISYGLSGTYQNQDPVMVGTSHAMYSLRTNFAYRLTKWLSGGTRLTYSNIDYKRVMSGQSNFSGAVRSITSAPPIFSPYDADGQVRDMLYGDFFKNPLAVATKYPITYKEWVVRINQYFKFHIHKDLSFKTNIAMDLRNNTQKSYFPKEYDNNGVDIYRFRSTDYNKFLWENTLEYHKKFRKSQLDAVLGCSYQFNSQYNNNMVGKNFMDEKQIVIQNAAVWSTITQTISEYSMHSYFGRVNYSYANKYMFTATLRADGSSRFGEDKRFGFFPSASLGWRFSDEQFMRSLKRVLSNAKLRASVGQTGSQTVGNYTWRGAYETTNRYDGNVAIVNTTLSNSTLGWETTTQYNVGLDLSFFQGRIDFTFDGYIKDTKDLLFSTPIPSYTGFGSRSENFGSIRNKGLEFALQTVNIERGDWYWSTNFNLSFNRNKITSLAYGEDVIYATNGVYSLAREGEPMGVFYGWKAKGVYANDSDNVWTDPGTGEMRKVLKGSLSGEAFKGGDMIWEDLDSNGIINDDDRMVIGDPNPDFIGGFGTTLSWKGLSLNAFFSFSVGNDIINCQKRLRYQCSTLTNFETDAVDRWRKQGDVTDFPMLRYGDPMDNFRCSSFIIEDGSYLRLKDISLSYTLPRELMRKIGLQSLAFTLSASNLLTWTKYTGYDPEVNTSTSALMSGLDNGAFPKARMFSAGINLVF